MRSILSEEEGIEPSLVPIALNQTNPVESSISKGNQPTPSLGTQLVNLDQLGLAEDLLDFTTAKKAPIIDKEAIKDVGSHQSQETKAHGPREAGQCTFLSLFQ